MLNIYKTILSQKTQLTADVYLYHFDLVKPREIKFKAGQYLMIKIPTDKGLISRLYSIASSATEKNHFELIIQIVSGGLASSYLLGLKVKDEAIFQGPAGTFILKENNRQKIFLITGTGITPIRSMLNSKFEARNSKQFKNSNFENSNLFRNSDFGFRIFLFWGLKTYRDVYLINELKELLNTVIPAQAGIQFKICLSREESLNSIPELDRKYFNLGHIDGYFNKQFRNLTAEQLNSYDFYLCGRRETVESLRSFLINKGIFQDNIYFEKF